MIRKDQHPLCLPGICLSVLEGNSCSSLGILPGARQTPLQVRVPPARPVHLPRLCPAGSELGGVSRRYWVGEDPQRGKRGSAVARSRPSYKARGDVSRHRPTSASSSPADPSDSTALAASHHLALVTEMSLFLPLRRPSTAGFLVPTGPSVLLTPSPQTHLAGDPFCPK